jgi:preprotein translocase subunit SecE
LTPKGFGGNNNEPDKKGRKKLICFYLEYSRFYKVAKKSSTEKEIEKTPDPENRKEKTDSNKTSRDLQKSFEDLKQYLRESLTELKKIHWPTRRQALGETTVVLITVIFLTILVIMFDKLLEILFSFIF